MREILKYLKKIFSKWFIYFSFIPGILGSFNFYFGLPDIILSWEVSFILFIILFFIASYIVWLNERKEKIKLEKRLKKIQDQKPKLSLSFENKEKVFELKNKFFERKLSSRGEDILVQNRAGGIKIISEIMRKPNHIVEDIRGEFVPLIFQLNNNGDHKATEFRIDVYFPKEIIVLEELPKNESPFLSDISSLIRKKGFGGFLESKGYVRLWGDKSLHPSSIGFDSFYISSKIKEKFKIKYVINAEELGADEIKGELIIKTSPNEEIIEYINKDRLEEDKDEYDKIIEEYSDGENDK